MLDGGPAQAPERTPVQRFWDQRGDGGFLRPGQPLVGWGGLRDQVRLWAAGLVAAGIRPGDRVAIVADVSPEWKIADLAIQAAGATLVPVYPTLSEEQREFVLQDAGAVAAFVEEGRSARVRCWPLAGPDELEAAGRSLLADDPEMIDRLVAADNMDRLSTIFYTSGTTGDPKGVPLRNRHWAASTETNVAGLRLDELEDPSVLMFLPMAHVAGYAAGMALIAIDGVIAFSTPAEMAVDFTRVQPTLLVAVPRLYERIVSKIREALATASPVRRWLFDRAEATAIAYGRAIETGRPSAGLRPRHAFFDRLVYRSLKRRLGFDRVQVGLTGAAAVRPELLYFLQGLGLNIVEAYGMTETTGLVTTNDFEDFRAGTVGRPMPGTRVRLAADGEVMIAGAMVLESYWQGDDPRVDIDGEAWLPTGDIGAIEDGRLSIIDRKKELEILDTGKMVAPTRVEAVLSASPLVEDCVIVGHGRSYIAALIQPAYDELLRASGVTPEEGEVVKAPDPTGAIQTYGLSERILALPNIRALYEEVVASAAGRLGDHERPKRFALLPHAFTVDTGELTPSFKKKRHVITANQKDRIDALYG